MVNLSVTDRLAIATVAAIHLGDVEALKKLLAANPGLAAARIVDAGGTGRTLLHVVADWPGHFPNGAGTVAVLAAAGADLNATVVSHKHSFAETALHGAASSDDVAVLDALLDAGADIEAPGAVFTGGPPMSDAVVFAQYNAARRLLERGARTTLTQAAALGLLDRVKEYCSAQPAPSNDDLTAALWHACRGAQRECVEYVLDRGATLNWIGWDRKTPLQAAEASGNSELIEWLRSRGARRADELA